jgi:Concanavalin A-like lectin/glucanases superfamily
MWRAGAKGEREAMAASPDLLLTGDLGFQKQTIKADEDGFIFDFSGATVHSAVYPHSKNAYPVVVNPDGHKDILVLGGTVIRHDDPDTKWGQSYKEGTHNAGLIIGRGDGEVTVDGLRVHNTHDGIVISGLPDEKDITLRHVYGTHLRDDAIENDGMNNLTVEDSLLDGVFVGFSAVNPGSTKQPGSDHPVTIIRDTLVRLESMPGDPTLHTERDGSGHGALFKWWDGRAPELVLENNIFVVEDKDAWNDKVNDKIVLSKNNVMIWMGEGEFRGKLPAGFTLIKGDDSLFQDAREDWLLRHGYDPNGTLKENLHAPVLDGAAPPQPEPPGSAGDLVESWELDRSFNGKNQKVVIDHDASLELDEGTVVLTFTADKLTGTQGLFSKDSFGFDDGGGLSVWHKKGQVLARLESESKSYLLQSEKGAVTAGEVSHVAVSFGDEGFRLYVGGKLVDQSGYTGGIADNSEPIVIGADARKSGDGTADKLSSFFDGTIHDVAIYGDQLAHDEIAASTSADLFNW